MKNNANIVIYDGYINISANFIHRFFKFYLCSQIDRFIALISSNEKSGNLNQNCY